MRKLATIRIIDAINAIPDADAIEVATVGGWEVVVKKGEYRVGDLAVYCEIDSWIPTELAPFLSKGQVPREYNGVKGERLRTVKLRGQVSQGLLLKVAERFDDVVVLSAADATPYKEGEDVTEALGIQKYEAPIPAQLSGEVRGSFPSIIPKTDQERCQNLTSEIAEWTANGLTFELTEKLDGSSMTVYLYDEGEHGVCSRNLDLKESDANSFWVVCRRERLIDKINLAGRGLALQGELIGEGIQGNPYKIKGQDFYLYDVYDIGAGRYFTPRERLDFAQKYDVKHVPVIAYDKDLSTGDVRTLLEWAEAKSTLNAQAEREGLVFKCLQDPRIHFKAISNRFLLKGVER
jgi:RNA ligase (TIGR02306 family)